MEPALKERAVEPEEAKGAVTKAARASARADAATKAKGKVEAPARAAERTGNHQKRSRSVVDGQNIRRALSCQDLTEAVPWGTDP